ncbi:ANTAR domain-containing protein [Mesorhizobium sp. VK23B]|uniref:ANTAR domain-containing protein n=1 Tax=Mesorhizobium dulcispinae TaxID=3072316 RepID=A0ABU4XBU9_9HYPH|nr:MULTISPECIES: ANTAR domain-containing protein [unclassified Mesorhizobium]MDX8464696.1 ANTAR domain-containing protein [Mesorhizobium sp. VK23B]MDX8471082.1 ANTAR domain-containing protein [Mesorhizobium sp. VK23A]
MSERIPLKDEDLLRRLRRMRVLVIHPDDQERAMLLAHIKRVGCQVEATWPAPAMLPAYVDVVLFLLDPSRDSMSPGWMTTCDAAARIAIIAFETPEILSALQRLNVHGVLSKPLRLFGVLAALTTAVSLASHEARLKQRIKSLDETLKSRRKIEKAVEILTASRNITEEEAYRRLREKAMNSKVTIASVAEAIIASSDL